MVQCLADHYTYAEAANILQMNKNYLIKFCMDNGIFFQNKWTQGKQDAETYHIPEATVDMAEAASAKPARRKEQQERASQH